MDTEINQDLKLEGYARELIRQINALRKKMDLSVGDLVEVVYQTKSKELKEVLKKLAEEIKANTLTKELIEGQAK